MLRHLFIFTTGLLLLVATALSAGEPWFEPARRGQMTADQKKWLDEREGIRKNVTRLQGTNYDNAEALNLVRSTYKQDLKFFGEKHEEVVKSLNYSAGRFYFAGEFKIAYDLKLIEYKACEDLFGADNWRLRSIDFKIRMYKELTKATSKQLRSMYGDAWDLDTEARNLRDKNKNAEAQAKSEESVRLLSQVGKACGVPDEENVELAGLLVEVAKAQRNAALYAKSEQMVRDALIIYKNSYGAAHPVYADTLTELANNHQKRGELAQSELASRDAIAIYEKAFDYPHRDVVNALEQLARVYFDGSKYGLAETTYLKALKLLDQVDSPYKFTKANILTFLAGVYSRTNRLDDAETKAREGLALAVETAGEQDQAWVNAAQQLNIILMNKKKYPEALELAEKALTTQVAITSGRHPYAGIVGAQTGKMRRLSGKYVEAEEVLRACLSNLRRNYGDANTTTLSALNTLGELFVELRDKSIKEGKLEAASDLQKKLVDIRAEVQPAGTWSLVEARHRLDYLSGLLERKDDDREPLMKAQQSILEADELRAANKFKEALPLMEKVLEAQADFPKTSFAVTETKARLGAIHHGLGDFTKADSFDREAAVSYDKLFTGTLLPPQAIECYMRIGRGAKQRGDFVEAVTNLEHARELYRRLYGKRNNDYLSAYQELFRARLDAGDVRPLESDARELVDLVTKQKGFDSPETLAAQDDLATVLRLTNQIEAADKILVDLQARSKPAAGPAGKDHIRALNQLGLLRRQMGKLDEASALFEQTVDFYGENFPTNDAVFAAYLANQATARLELGEIPTAETLLRRAIALFDKLKIKNEKLTPRLITIIEMRVQQQLTAGKLDDAKKSADEAAALTKTHFGEQHPRTVLAGVWLKNVQALTALPEAKIKAIMAIASAIAGIQLDLANGQFAEALPKIDGYVKTGGEHVGVDHLDLSPMLVLKSKAQIGLGQTEAALKSLEQAQAISAKALGENHPEVGQILLATARLRFERSEYALSLNAARQALALFEKGPDARSLEIGWAHLDIAHALLRSGDYAAAHNSFRLADDILFRLQVDHPDDYVECLLAQVEWSYTTGDMPRAKTLLAQAAGLVGPLVRVNSRLQAELLMTQALVEKNDGDRAKAASLAAQAIEAYGKSFGEKSLKRAEALNFLALIRLELGKTDDGERMIAEARQIRSAAIGKPSTEDIHAAAMLALGKGDLAAAEKNLRAAIEAKRQAKEDLGDLLLSLGVLLHQQGKEDEAEKLYREDLDLGKALLGSLLIAQREAPSMQLIGQRREALDRLLSLSATVARNEVLYPHWLAWKGSASTRSRLIQTARAKPELAGLFQRHGELSIRLATIATRLPFEEERPAWYAQVEALTREFEFIEEEILQRAQLERPPLATFDQVRRALPEKAVLIDFVEYTHYLPPAKGQTRWSAESRLAAFILRPGKAIERVEIGQPHELGLAISEWRRLTDEYADMLFALEKGRISKEKIKESEDLEKAHERLMLRLNKLLWEPLAPKVDGADTLYISADGELGKFPFPALLIGKDEFLLERFTVTVTPIPALLPTLRTSQPLKLNGATALTFGGIDFNAAPEKIVEKPPTPIGKKGIKDQFLGSTIFNRPGVKALANSGPETEAIGKLLRKNLGDGVVAIRLAQDASENQYRALSPKNTWQHFATHGFFAPNMVPARFGRMPGGEVHRAVSGNQGVPRILYDPGLFSGLTLAGANEANDPDQDDGILWAFEVANSDLRHVELVVLSACDTAIGIVAPGEGILGLQRAFHQAGAKTVLATYWPVFDHGARLMMERFFANMVEKKMPPDAALREAQIWLLTAARKSFKKENDANYPQVPFAYGTPFAWSPFFLSGQ